MFLRSLIIRYLKQYKKRSSENNSCLLAIPTFVKTAWKNINIYLYKIVVNVVSMLAQSRICWDSNDPPFQMIYFLGSGFQTEQHLASQTPSEAILYSSRCGIVQHTGSSEAFPMRDGETWSVSYAILPRREDGRGSHHDLGHWRGIQLEILSFDHLHSY